MASLTLRRLLLVVAIAVAVAATAETLSALKSGELVQPAIFGRKQAIVFVALLLIICAFLEKPAGRTAYLLDLHCFKIPDRLKTTREKFISEARQNNKEWFSDELWDFQRKVAERSGLGDETNAPDGVLALKDASEVTRLTREMAMVETQEIIFNVTEEVLRKTRISAQEVDAVIVSCSCFTPVPSMAAMLVNKFKMREDVLTYNFSGMGCSSSLVCVDLARHLLAALPNKLILIVNHENLTNNWYNGKDKSMLVCNCLFRVGGAAALMTNRPKDMPHVKYELRTTMRTHLGNEDEAFGCMGVSEDAEGVRGVFLRKNVVEIAGRALKRHVVRLAPRVLPFGEIVRYLVLKSYSPKFSKAFDHFLLHTGGRGVLDALETHLALSQKQAQPSKDTLRRFGNTSAASTWYILACIEHEGGMRKGDRIWQLGFGGGFKCNSAIWRACKDIHQFHDCWEYSESKGVPKL